MPVHIDVMSQEILVLNVRESIEMRVACGRAWLVKLLRLAKVRGTWPYNNTFGYGREVTKLSWPTEYSR
eukprot:3623737-Pleurochrysis_carterae.AAC.2